MKRVQGSGVKGQENSVINGRQFQTIPVDGMTYQEIMQLTGCGKNAAFVSKRRGYATVGYNRKNVILNVKDFDVEAAYAMAGCVYKRLRHQLPSQICWEDLFSGRRTSTTGTLRTSALYREEVSILGDLERHDGLYETAKTLL